VIVERDPDTGLFVGSVPGWPGAHSQGASFEELEKNLREVIAMLLEDGDPKLALDWWCRVRKSAASKLVAADMET